MSVNCPMLHEKSSRHFVTTSSQTHLQMTCFRLSKMGVAKVQRHSLQNMTGFESRLLQQLAHTRQDFEDHIRRLGLAVQLQAAWFRVIDLVTVDRLFDTVDSVCRDSTCVGVRQQRNSRSHACCKKQVDCHRLRMCS